MSDRSARGSTEGSCRQRVSSVWADSAGAEIARSSATGLPARVTVTDSLRATRSTDSPRATRSTTSPPWLRSSRLLTFATDEDRIACDAATPGPGRGITRL